jgi:hypothetical protein
MNAKHYVSQDVAKMLKEKGHNEFAEYAYDKNGEIGFWGRNVNHMEGLYSMPILLEAMDWLEVRGIRISIKYDWIECGWYYIVIDLTPTVKNITEVEKSDGIFYKDRNECMNEAIKKGLELL